MHIMTSLMTYTCTCTCTIMLPFMETIQTSDKRKFRSHQFEMPEQLVLAEKSPHKNFR